MGQGLGPAEQKVKLEELAQYLYELLVLFDKDDSMIGHQKNCPL